MILDKESVKSQCAKENTYLIFKCGSRNTTPQYEGECSFLQKEVMYLLKTPFVILLYL